MKKFFTLILSLSLAFGLVACSSGNSDSTSNSGPTETQTTSESETTLESDSIAPDEESEALTEDPTETEGGKTLIVYFSMPETTDPDNMTQEEDNSTVVINGEVLGNTQYVAYVIQENIGADIFCIEPETPYPTDHDTLVDLAAEEQDQAARPAIKDHIENLEQYDTIFIGFPNWWGDMLMILYSFFD